MKYVLPVLAVFLMGATYQLPEGYEYVPDQVSADDGLKPVLINGRPAEEGEYPEIVNIRTGNSLCTATVVGPRTILTAAHCAETGATSRFSYNGVSYNALMTRSPLYPDQDHDMALGVLDKDLELNYATIAGVPALNDDASLTGYGCTRAGGGGGNDGILRVGDSTIVGFRAYDFITRRSDGAALCFGDSGGPAYVYMGDAFSEKHQLMGVNSKGNISDTSLLTRTDLPESQDFFKKFAADNSVQICGINRECNKPSGPPPGCWEKFKTALATLFDELSGCTRNEPEATQD